MNEQQAQRLTELLNEAIAVLRGEADPAVEAPAPPGMIAVRPTGPKGAGKVRYWPDVATLLQPETNFWGYVTQIADQANPATGEPYIGSAWRGPYFPGIVNELVGKYGKLAYAECADRLQWPEEWMVQAELDMAAKLAERDRAQGSTFSPR